MREGVREGVRRGSNTATNHHITSYHVTSRHVTHLVVEGVLIGPVPRPALALHPVHAVRVVVGGVKRIEGNVGKMRDEEPDQGGRDVT